ncbi:chromosome partitioning protein ParA, partial [Bifidobacteriaceae bacterium NR020]
DALQSDEEEKSQTKERATANIKQYESQISNLHKEVDNLKESIASDSAQIKEYDTKISELETALEKVDQNDAGNIYSLADQFRKVSNDQVSLSKKVEENKKLVADKERALNELETLFT